MSPNSGNLTAMPVQTQGLFLGILLLTVLPAGAVNFEREVKPFLEKKCLGCHNPNILKGELDLSTAAGVFKAGHEIVVPGASGNSDLYLAVVPDSPGGKPAMPEEGEPLTEAEADLLSRWIDEGAAWPEGLVLKEASKTDRSWWAYQTLKESPHATIDAHIDEALAKQGLKRNPPAGKRELIRRLSYDLTGLPPTQEEVEAFAADADPEAYERLVDRLLASPHYGERWGRHWLDVVRFGESRGYERNQIIDNLWPFRDYVIGSFNEDKPMDRLIREHLAGDVVGKGRPDIEIGSAFLVAGPYDDVGNQDKAQAAQIRANTLDEIINATGEAFLGMTLGCARCHDHKFDPISQRDYYALYATFAGVRHGERVLATAEEKADRAARLKPLETRRGELDAEIKRLEAAILERGRGQRETHETAWVRPRPDRTGTEERFAAVEAKFVRFISEGLDTNPAIATGYRLDEFEVWSSGPEPRNVALAANGGKATGASRRIDDFPDAYGPQLTIDGKFGAHYHGTGNDLTIGFAAPVWIDRVFFSSARNEESPAQPKFTFVSDYRIEVSADGKEWREVANGRDRKPVSEAHRDVRLARLERTPEETARIAGLRADLAAVDRDIAAIPALPKVWMGNPNEADAKGPFHLFIGGSPQKPGEPVAPASLSTLAEVAPGYEMSVETPEAQRRAALADWIVHPDNPLTPRVLANRVWQYHFGTGIVDTPNDFGYMGGRPTHPELLDFLAMQLKESGWKLKPLHRLIVLSGTYRQSSTWQEVAGRVDGDSRLLWRFPPRRLSAEEVRDTILVVSGKLDRRRGGPGYRLYQYMQDNVSTYAPLDAHGPETYRRAVYHQNARASVVDLMTEFDQPDCAFSAPARAETTTPLQALTMMNHAFTLDMAAAFADRIAEAGPWERDQAAAAFRIAYQREAGAGEIERTAAALREAGLPAVARALLNTSELIHLD